MEKTPIGILAFLCGFGVAMIQACGNGPKLTVYISDPTNNGMEFFNERTGEKGFVKYEETEKFIAFTPADAQMMFDYCGLGKKK